MSEFVKLISLRLALCMLLVSLPAVRAQAQTATPPDYSAKAVHLLPDGTRTEGVVYKSGPNMRFEYTEGGRPVVQIVRQAEGVIYLIDPSSQSYFELHGAPAPDATGIGYLPPCQEGDPTVTCTKTGTATTSGITAEVWELSRPGQQGVTRILWDGQRHRALQQTYPDGSRVTMAFRAMVDLSGRNVEHWTVTYESPGQPPQSGNWYFDPVLRVEVREEMPSGEVRSLEDISVNPVDPAKFSVPQGFARMEMPAQPAPAPVPEN